VAPRQWLEREQTAGKEHPFLFTQCQAIHARSLLPCQDTPGNKCPYRAAITVPAPLVAVMSALSAQDAPAKDAAGRLTYHFKQDVPTCTYLIALAVGALERREVGPRSAVWSEKEIVDRAAHEVSATSALSLARHSTHCAAAVCRH
jgi:leukotriene-A4 hydrolase